MCLKIPSKFSILWLLVLSFVCTATHADSFDDAVNLYLKGFDHCTAAKVALADADADRAQAEFALYSDILRQAEAIDKSVSTTSKRGMESNMKFCNRVLNDIQVGMGMPILEKGLTACDEAIAALKARDPELARAKYKVFVEQRDLAYNTAPGLSGVFSVKSEVRRCERQEAKITSFSQERAALTLALESALEESENFQQSCTSVTKELTEMRLSPQAVAAAEKSLAKVQAHKKSAATDVQAYSALIQGAKTPESKIMEANLAKGEQCLKGLQDLQLAQSAKFKSMQAELVSQGNTLTAARQTCDRVAGYRVDGASQAQYDKAKSEFESARSSRDRASRILGKNALYTEQGDLPQVRDLNAQLASLNSCLDNSRKQLNGLLAAVSVAAVAAPNLPKLVPPKTTTLKAEPKTAEPQKAEPAKTVDAKPAVRLTGTLTISDVLPEMAVLFWDDGTRANNDEDIIIFSTGFDKKSYFITATGNLAIKNSDFSAHSLSVVASGSDDEMSIASIGPRQKRVVQARVAANSIAVLRSNQSRVVPSYLINVPSKNAEKLEFSENSNTLAIDLGNSTGARKGGLLIPYFDPLMFEISQGEEKTLPVTRNKLVVGKIVLKGI